MSKIDYQALRERYSPKPVPECHICGKEMTIQHMSASRITYGCTGEGNDGYFKFGRTFADEHYEKSRVTVVDVSDPDVLELLDELETKEEQRANWFQMAQKLGEDLDAAEKRNAEQREYYEGVIADGSKRIAELESNEVREVGNQFLVVRHPGKLPVIKHCVGELEDFLRQLIERDSLVTIDIITHRYYGVGGQWVQDADEYLQMMQGAGIGVKGE
ncbi:TPA: ead/Ea22-like family protein [Salmonella enterica]|uniref:Ead/Ea22-like family protein n=1 Tax=Salmonella enterica TaxID=28901 RepID=A0A743WC93_SALER|nr:ead/Ea22-like family protein [Salmonella enterica]